MARPDGSYTVGGGTDNFGQALNEGLVRSAFEFPMAERGNMIELLRMALSRLPEESLKPFQWFLGKNDDEWGGQGVAAIVASLKERKAEWIKDFEDKTGLNVDEGIQKFLESLKDQQKANRMDWVTEFETNTGLNVDAGAVAFLQSLLVKLQPTLDRKADRDEWIAQFESKTGLNIDEGAAKFLESMVLKLRSEWRKDVPDWVTEFETKTGLEIDSGVAAFLVSLKTLLRPEWQKDDGAWIADFEAKTGLNIDEGTVKFAQSLVAKLRPEWQKDVPDWVTEFEAKTGLNIDAGAAAFIQSLITKLNPTYATKTELTAAQSAWIADFETKTGLDIDNGVNSFITSLLAKLNPTYATKPELAAAKTAWVTDFETNTGLDIDAGVAAFLTSLVAKMKPEWVKDTTPISDKIRDMIDGWSNAFDGGSGRDRPVQDAIQAWIENAKGVKAAKDAADLANIGVAAIRAEQAGGFSDEFNYPNAATLSAPWQLVSEGVLTTDYGPDGAGALVWKGGAGFVGTGFRYYLRTDKLLTSATAGSVTVVLSKAPRQNALAPAHAYVIGKGSATDKACVRAEISAKTVEIQIVNAAGTVSRGSTATIACTDGDVFELVWDATNARLLRNGIEVIRRAIGTAVSDANHRLIGLGAMIPPYTVLNAANNPCPGFAGIAWHG